MPTPSSSTATRWLALAIASGTFAALNGLFAKLTTTAATGSTAHSIANALGLSEGIIEALVRAICFALNLLSNVIMWALFTRALTAAPSTTKVSITNTAANFLVTAVLGMIVFGERVGGLWWIGAAMMGAGCILVGMREDKNKNGSDHSQNLRREGEQQEEEEQEEINLDGEEAHEADEYHDDDEQESDEDAPLVSKKRTKST